MLLLLPCQILKCGILHSFFHVDIASILQCPYSTAAYRGQIIAMCVFANALHTLLCFIAASIIFIFYFAMLFVIVFHCWPLSLLPPQITFDFIILLVVLARINAILLGKFDCVSLLLAFCGSSWIALFIFLAVMFSFMPQPSSYDTLIAALRCGHCIFVIKIHNVYLSFTMFVNAYTRRFSYDFDFLCAFVWFIVISLADCHHLTSWNWVKWFGIRSKGVLCVEECAQMVYVSPKNYTNYQRIRVS